MIWYVVAAFFCFAGPSRHRLAAGQSDDPSLSPWRFKYHADNAWDGGPAAGNPATGNGSAAAADPMDVFRLPADVKPVSYALRVDTDFGDLTFSGRVTVVVIASASTCRITLNAKDLRVTEVRVIDQKSGQRLTVDYYGLVEKNEQLVIAMNDTNKSCLFVDRQYSVEIAFNAPLRDDMSGYYKSSYRENNHTKWLAVTKFEATHARKAFPCFDEPALKTPFRIAIKRRSDQISLSNMPLMESTRIEQTHMYWDYFQETPPISTYLVAFFVGEFFGMKTRTIGIYTHKDYVKQAEYIANKSPKLLEAMENFTGVDYTLPKLDLLAIPDFAAGAMENWGLNTYRERLLLVLENSKSKTKEFVTTVVQHELSHQWFGDLVTCAWWDYLWLNEGFATFFEYFGTKMVEPDWRLEDVFIYEVHQLALKSDQIPTHPISNSVETPAEISSMFDDISYSKAGAVLRMLLYTVTELNFRNALHLYLESNKYKAATPEHLWIAFENVLFDDEFDLGENITITKFMKSWTEQSGYPLISINKVNNTFVITQKRFLVKPENKTDTTKWIIGLTYTTENNNDFNEVLPKIWLTENKTVLSNQNQTGWYIFNLQSTGFYRVNYELDNWNALIGQLYKNCNVIHVLNRAQIIDDAFNLARAKQVDYTLVLRLSKYLVNENDVIPWYSAKDGFRYLMSRMRRCPGTYKNLKLYVRYLAGSIFAKTNAANQNVTAEHSMKTGWNEFSRWACNLQEIHCTKLASSYFNSWRKGERIPADIKDAAFCVGVKHGTSEVWNSMLNVYVNSESASDRQSAQLALACSKDPVQLSKYLDFMLDGYNSSIRPQDFRVIYQTMATSPEGISALLKFLTDKLDRIVSRMTNGENVATSIYSLLASAVASDDEILKLDKLRTSPSVPANLQKRFNSSYAKVEDNLAWFNAYSLRVDDWANVTVRELGLNDDFAGEREVPSFSGASDVSAFVLLIISSTVLLHYYGLDSSTPQ